MERKATLEKLYLRIKEKEKEKEKEEEKIGGDIWDKTDGKGT